MSTAADARPPARGLAFKLALFVLTSAMLIFAGAFAYYYHSSERMLLRTVRENARNLLRGSVCSLEIHLAAVEQIPRYMAATLSRETPAQQVLERRLRDFLLANPNVYGTATAYAPGAFDTGHTGDFAPYACREKGRPDRIAMRYLQHYGLDNWYLVPKELGRPEWSEPYFDESGGDIVMSTYSVPFFRSDAAGRVFQGVVTADISLDWLRHQVGKIAMYHSGYAFLVSKNGVFVSHPDNRMIMRESIFSLAEAQGSESLRHIGQSMIRGEEGFARLPEFVLGKPSWLAYAPMPATGWSMGVIVPEDELFADLSQLGREVAAIGAGGSVLLILVIVAIAASITRPLSRLALTADAIAQGNLDTPVPTAASGDEVGRLSRSFEQMRLALKDYIANLTATTKAKERLESELKIGHNIQMSFLPKRFPPFPDIKAFDLHADLTPAREVGGDLYDFFLIGPTKVLFLVGDVSGKGVPAALFMAVTKTLIKGIAEQESDPAEILSKVNRELCVDNDSMLFVTMFLAILDYATGELVFSNAGHNPPARIAPDGAVSWLVLPRGIFLGVMEDAVYRTARITMAPGEKLVAFTDGVTEAMDIEQTLFGTARLETVLAKAASLGAEALDATVMEAVRAFAGEAEQADDITVVSMVYRG